MSALVKRTNFFCLRSKILSISTLNKLPQTYLQSCLFSNNNSKPNINYFDILDLPQKFSIKDEEIAKSFKQKMMEYHPDKYNLNN